MLVSFEVWKSLICGYFSASAETRKFKSWSSMKRRNVYNWRVLHLQQCLPYFCPLQLKFCALRLQWLGTGRRTLTSLSLSSWPKASAAVFFYTDKFCCKVCLRFLKNANKKLEVFPNRMLGYYEIVWREISVYCDPDSAIGSRHCWGEKVWRYAASSSTILSSVSQSYFCGCWNSLVYCFILFTAFPFPSS